MTIRGHQKKIQDLSREIVLLKVKYEEGEAKYEEGEEAQKRMSNQLLEDHTILRELSVCFERLKNRAGGTTTVSGTVLWVWQGVVSGNKQDVQNRFSYLLKQLKQSGAGIEEGMLPEELQSSPFLEKIRGEYYFIER